MKKGADLISTDNYQLLTVCSIMYSGWRAWYSRATVLFSHIASSSHPSLVQFVLKKVHENFVTCLLTGQFPSTCQDAGFQTCCFRDNCQLPSGCNCDHACYSRGDCCEDISLRCPGKDYTNNVFHRSGYLKYHPHETKQQ